MKNIICPYCGESYYAERYSTRTAMGWTPVYKDGVLLNKDPNITTTNCLCLNCHKKFAYRSDGTCTGCE